MPVYDKTKRNQITMEETKQGTENCGCEGDCCSQPKKKPSWMKWISILILIAAVAVVVIKLATPDTAAAPGKQQATACDTTKGTACDTSGGSACCPKSGK
jgi:hypothetical protein